MGERLLDQALGPVVAGQRRSQFDSLKTVESLRTRHSAAYIWGPQRSVLLLAHQSLLLLPREYALPVVLHADNHPLSLLGLGHEGVRESANLRLGP